MKKYVHIIDDDNTTLASLKRVIEDEVEEVLGQNNSVEVITYIRPQNFLKIAEKKEIGRFDFVIVDYLMPEMNGVQLIQKMREELIPNNESIVLFTGNKDHLTETENDVLAKMKVTVFSKTERKGVVDRVIAHLGTRRP